MAQRERRSFALVILFSVLLCTVAITQPLLVLSEEPGLDDSLAPDASALMADLPVEVRLKIEPQLLKEFIEGDLGSGSAMVSGVGSGARRTFLVHLGERADLRAAKLMARGSERREAVVTELKETASRSQGPILSVLKSRLAEGRVEQIQNFWVFNGMAVTADLATMLELARRPDVEMIRANHTHYLSTERIATAAMSQGPEWNVEQIRADDVWQSYGITGEGIVVANMDTGVDWQHPALQRKYRGYNATNPDASDHNYSWVDFTGTYPDEPGPQEPHIGVYSDHGTHTMGTLVGGEVDGSDQVGVAPGASWVAIRVFDNDGVALDTQIHAGFQWALAPTDLQGDNPRPDLAPDIVSNSWGDPDGSDTSYWDDILALDAAGIMSVYSGGNDGPDGGTIGSPASYPFAFGVGATDANDAVAGLSSRGPSPWGHIEPKVTAPGVSVRSTIPGGGYEGGWSGTSMAAPHVAGVAALLWQADRQLCVSAASANPTLTLTRTKRVITSTAVHPVGQTEVPDNNYGWGRVDAFQAVATLVESGTFWGRVSDAISGVPISSALVTMIRAGSSGEASATTDAGGWYTFSVAAGMYDVTASRFRYSPRTVREVEILAHTTTQLDFKLELLSTCSVGGRITAIENGEPLSASVSLEGTPLQAVTDASGRYTLTAPVGEYELLVWPALPGHRAKREPVSLPPGGFETLDFALEGAPSVILVDADSWVPATEAPYYEQALRRLLYPYDTHSIDEVGAIPSFGQIEDYDIVIWSQPESSPGSVGAWGVLGAYLDAGGNLFISGQDIGYWDDFAELGLQYYRKYLHARYVVSDAGPRKVEGRVGTIMAGLELDLNAPDSARNQTAPSEIAVADMMAQPILDYEGDGVAGLQGDDCVHKVVYLAFGLGGSGPEESRTALLERAIEWLTLPAPEQAIQASVESPAMLSEAGSVAVHRVTLMNRGSEADSFGLSVTGAVWPTSIWDQYGDSRITGTIDLGSCETQRVQVRVEVPAEALIGDRNDATLVARSRANPDVAANAEFSTVFLPSWQTERAMPMPRYRHAAVVDDRCRLYLFGGVGGDYSDVILDATERYVVNEDRWETMADKPTAAANVAAAMLDGLAYVVGGYDDSLNEAYLDTVEAYDPESDTWRDVASLPRPLCGAAVAAADGKVYAFGGSWAEGELRTTYAYDPASDGWTQMRSMPGGGRAYAVAAVLNGRVYVAGGWPDMKRVECYDPSDDSWTTIAPMLVGRQSPGLVAFGGFLYAMGGGQGWEAIGSVERYDPVSGVWEETPQLRGSEHAACAAAVVGSRIFVLGGTGAVTGKDVESLLVGPSLGLSRVSVDQDSVAAGDTLTYEILLRNPSAWSLQGARMVNPMPEGVEYVPGSATGGAAYDASEGLVSWEGSLASGEVRRQSFQVKAVDGLANNTAISNTTFLYDGVCGRHSRVVCVVVHAPDLSPSTKSVDKPVAPMGDTLEYTIRLLNASPFTLENASLTDPVPAGTQYVEASAGGGAVYDPNLEQVTWCGTVPAGRVGRAAYWEDSDEEAVEFAWIDATSGTRLLAGDDRAIGPLDLGFTFDFWGQEYSEFYVNTNGQVLFGTGSGAPTNAAIPDASLPDNFIAAFWDDLDPGAAGGIYYRTLGTAPHRYTVVEWADVPRYGGSDRLTFEVVLYEGSNDIVLQYLHLQGDRSDGDSATVGIENANGSEGTQYLRSGEGPGFPLHDNLAVRLIPARDPVPGEHSVAFRVRVNAPAPAGTVISNAAVIDDGVGHIMGREAVTTLAGADLSPSQKLADRASAAGGDNVGYCIRLTNAGTLSATEVSVVDPIPDGTSYVPGTVTGGAAYDAGSKAIVWNGTVDSPSWSNYSWRDSDSGDVQYEWIDASSGQLVPPADDASRGPYPLGFTFTFYDEEYTEFYINTNGQVLLGTGSDAYSNRPIPSVDAPNGFIAPFWDDLTPNLGGRIHYRGYGAAPDRRTVIAWEEVPAYSGGGELTFEVVLFERDGSILLQYQSLEGAAAGGTGATVGIENPTGEQGIEYLYNGWGHGYPLHDGLAVLFAPEQAWPEIGFEVLIDDDLPAATLITNTAVIAVSDVATYERSAEVLVNPVEMDLAVACSVEDAEVGSVLTYAISLSNTGAARIPAASLIDAIPAHTTYVPGSVTGGASFNQATDAIDWTGPLEIGEQREFTFAVAADLSAPDGTVVTNTVRADDGFGGVLQRSVGTTLRGPEMSWSEKRVDTKVAQRGETVTYTVRLRNTGGASAAAEMRDVLPSEIECVPGSVWASGGEVAYVDGEVTWHGDVIPSGMLLVRYQARVGESGTSGSKIRNVAVITDQSGRRLRRSCSVWVDSVIANVPLVFKQGQR